MAVIVYAESDNGLYKKSSFEAVTYGKDLANKLGTTCLAVSIGSKGAENLGTFGADKHMHVENDVLATFNPQAYSKVLSEVFEGHNGSVLVLSQTYNGKSIAPLCAVKQNAALVTGIVDMADTNGGFTVKKTTFSSKAIAHVSIKQDKKVLTVIPNSYKIARDGDDVSVEEATTSVIDGDVNSVVISINKETGKVPLTEAELVISAGRGLKGPENWNLVEDLAAALGAATACSKPVSDMEWRPHSEHVGQTGITIVPNLYIAAGISGAIQHLAGVSSSKVICVINTDPEAPFFKAADYGIVGDVFEVLPKLLKRVKEVRGQS
ncbi:electron transfer flavoprotein subunit alpha/FixB family protein [Bacteroidia bacterium]|jgi:electron transfer flavoprotein alpha subunit|nr:electron transfer flavoprotein subunit alpha/FixB family protein [Bacteroidia bacterium]